MTPRVGLPALEALSAQYATCRRCPALCDSRTNVVFGMGSATAPLLIVGTGPGATEDMEGVPFIGPAARLLLELLATAWPADPELTEILNQVPRRGPASDPILGHEGELHDYLSRYICWTNVTLCYPPEGRAPSHNEIKACKDRLHRVIYAVDPVLILALGKTPSSLLAGCVVDVARKRGSILDVSIPIPEDPSRSLRYAMMVVYDPGYLRQVGDVSLVPKKQGRTWETLEDLKYALSLLQEHRDVYTGRSSS